MCSPGWFLHLATKRQDDAILEAEVHDCPKGELPGFCVGPPAPSGLFDPGAELLFFPRHPDLHPILGVRRGIPVHLGNDDLGGLVALSPA